MNGIPPIDAIIVRLRGTLFRDRLTLFLGGTMGVITGMILVFILLSLIAGIFILPVWLKISLLGLSLVLLSGLAWRLAFSRLLKGSLESTALKIEQKYPELKGRLVAALQFHIAREKLTKGFSTELIDATLVQAEKKASGLDFNLIISAWPVWKNLRALAVSTMVALALLFIFPGLFTHSIKVYSSPTEVIAPPLGYRLSPYPGDKTAVKYRDLDLGAVLQGDKLPSEATINYRFADGNWQKAEIDIARQRRVTSSYGDSVLFYVTLKQVRRSLDYFVEAGRLTTPTHHIEVVDRPRVTGIKLSLFYPEYTGLPPTVIDENDGNITAVMGTRVNMQIESNLPVKLAEMVWSDSSRTPFSVNGRLGEQSFRVEKDQRYYVHLLDYQNETSPDPIEYRVTAIPDEYPLIEVARPGMDINLNEEMQVPLLLRLWDDFGFSSLVMKFAVVRQGERGSEQVAVLHFSDKIKTEGEVNFQWDVEPLDLMPADYVVYSFELADNDRISGPKVTKSREYIARLPSLDEIIAQTDREQQANIDRAETFLKQHKELSERLKNIAREMEEERASRNQQPSWQHQKELEDIAASEEKITENVREAAQELDKMIDQMQENRMASRELLEKLAQIQKLFEEIATPEMREARMKLMEALKNMDPKQLEEAMKDFQLSQKDLMDRLDRTISLLKKMQVEQKVTEIAELARQLAEEQDKVNKGTEVSDKNSLPTLAPEERKVKEGLNNIRKETAKLRDLLNDSPFSKSPEAESFCQAVENTDAGQNMDNMASDLEQSAKEEALEEGKQAYSKLLKMADQLQQGQQSMCNGGDAQLAGEMRNAINDIDYLADGQEVLMNEAGQILGGSEVLRDLAARQQVLKESLLGLATRVTEMGMKSPFVAAELSNLVQEAVANSNQAIEQFSGLRSREAITFQNESLFNLNRAAVRMMDALEQQSQCNKGGSCDKPSQMMQSMSQKQSEINQQTQSQCQNPGNRMGTSDVDAFRRLAAEQMAVGKSLSELQKEFGDSREILGRLDGIREDIDKISEALSSGEVGEATLERQLQVYSRMLDASRTMQRKDFTDQRKASVGKDILRNSPPALSGNRLQGGLDVEDRLRQFLNEKYPPEYEQHIKAYFKALLENAGYLNAPVPVNDAP